MEVAVQMTNDGHGMGPEPARVRGLVIDANGSIVPRYDYRLPRTFGPGRRNEAESFLSRGVSAHRRNRLEEAAKLYRDALRSDPSFYDAWYNLGVVYYEMSEWEQALRTYENALNLNPYSVKARYNFAMTLKRAGYYADAAEELETVLAEAPGEVKAHLALANLYARELNQSAKARRSYLNVLNLEPQHQQGTAIRYWLESNP